MSLLVAGGGLAGGAVACALARAGADVTLIERETQATDKICGEFVSIEAQATLSGLGLDLGALGGQPISHLRLVRGARFVTTALPFVGLGLSRKTLDEALLTQAVSLGARLRRGQAVREVNTIGGLAVRLGDAEWLRPEALFLATGKHDMRGARRRATGTPDLVGFKTYFRLAPGQQAALAGHIELLMFRRGYAGLQLVEGGRANFCCLVDRAWLREAGGDWPGILAAMAKESPHLAARLADAEALLDAPLTIARVPYGFVHEPGPEAPRGLFRLGDQAAVIQSFTGDGMSVSLHSAALAAQTFIAGGDGSDYHRRLASDVGKQVRRAGGLYGIASSPSWQPAFFTAARLFPAALARAAAWTRVPKHVRLQNQQHQHDQQNQPKTAAIIHSAGADEQTAMQPEPAAEQN